MTVAQFRDDQSLVPEQIQERQKKHFSGLQFYHLGLHLFQHFAAFAHDLYIAS